MHVSLEILRYFVARTHFRDDAVRFYHLPIEKLAIHKYTCRKKVVIQLLDITDTSVVDELFVSVYVHVHLYTIYYQNVLMSLVKTHI